MRRLKEKATYPAWQKKTGKRESFMDFVRRMRENVICVYQRAKFGYCFRDIRNIDDWFLHIMPNMIDELNKTTVGYPGEAIRQEIDTESLAGRSEDEITEILIAEWGEILGKISSCFREACEETCSYVNPYKEEYDSVWEVFQEKYGFWGERFVPEGENKGTAGSIWYTPEILPENREISEKYSEEEEKKRQYRDECKNEGLRLWGKWFWHLWY